MPTLLLIRAGRTEYESQGRIQGTLDVPLSEDGRRQVEEAAEQLLASGVTLDALYGGPCRAAQQTAEILGERLHLRPKTLEPLHNLDQGLWQGRLVEEVRNTQPKVFRQWQEQPETVCPPGGETLQEARQRCRKALQKVLKKHKRGSVALVLPEPLATVVRGLLTEQEVSGLWPTDRALATAMLWESIPLSVS